MDCLQKQFNYDFFYYQAWLTLHEAHIHTNNLNIKLQKAREYLINAKPDRHSKKFLLVCYNKIWLMSELIRTKLCH